VVNIKIGRHYKKECRFEITNLGKPKVIIGKNWMKTHGYIPNPITEELWFIGGHYTHEGAPLIIPI
jgi:hypothetical protein